ncbi:alanine--tRNA ligase [Clostridia bacterium]|nr:alanine--tRNA ligase [Clostridia bacterium]
MKWTGLNELRDSYLEFFRAKSHTVLKSAPLIPQNDNSTLLINAGMTPLKKYFQGIEKLPGNRAASCQKCIRTPDIENVGKTARHGTFFEMLGNFSFGDYFKSEAIAWAWEYFTKVLSIPEDKLWVTIFEDDDEAGVIWREEQGLPPERVIKLGRKDNFWEHGSGPCGPCSEIHFDRGEDKGCGSPDCAVGCECDRYVEIWNLVFTQFDSDGKGKYTPLASKNIDTGMGLERLACVIQDVNSIFEVDTVKNIMQRASDITGKKYHDNDNDDTALRILTDHARSATFMIGDGIRPSNEGRGYVLRRIIRRAARYARMLGVSEPMLYSVCEAVIAENRTAYPELNGSADYILKTVRAEEESFARTIENGMRILESMAAKLSSSAGAKLSGEDVFKLHDTYGFPVDLTREILLEKGIGIDIEKFRELMQVQKDTARANGAFKGGWDEAAGGAFAGRTSIFVGYEQTETRTRVQAIVHDGKSVSELTEGQIGLILLEATPFYAESGGQTGDIGTITGVSGTVLPVMKVFATKKTPDGKSVCAAEMYEPGQGAVLKVGDEVRAEADVPTRNAIRRNHTSAHLLQAALRAVLGEHVHQAGSNVDAYRCRFDFSHFSALTRDEIAEVELLVNRKILEGIPVVTEELPLEEAAKRGATALFGEKYGAVVRVVTVPDFSVEFCGGTHIDNTGKIGLFRIIAETAVASGVRRIEAVTGIEALNVFRAADNLIADIGAVLKTADTVHLPEKCRSLQTEISVLKKEKDKLQRAAASGELSGKIKRTDYKGTVLLTAVLSGVTGDALRKAGDNAADLAGNDNFIAIFAGVDGEKGNILVKAGAAAVAAGFHAGKIAGAVSALTGGKGGGKPDSAMAGIGDVTKAAGAVEKIEVSPEEIL